MRFIRIFPAIVLLLALLVPAVSLAADELPFQLPWEGKASGQTREFSATVGRIEWELAPGKVVQAYAYNGQVPGPELRVAEGDLVRVTVTNSLDEPTTVHWHGVDLPVGMDGTPGFSQDPILPGASFTYEFVATPSGTLWYHSHFNELAQHGAGLVGALIVEPRDEAAPLPDRDYTLMAGEWATATGGSEYAHTSMDHAGMGHGTLVERPRIDTFAVNGKSYPNTAPLMVRQGERVRLRLINAGLTDTQVYALAGHQLSITHSDGHALIHPVEAQAVLLGAGERADVEFIANNPGRWQLRALGPGQTEIGLATDVVYEGHESDLTQGLPAGARPQPASYLQFQGPPRPAMAERTYDMVLAESTEGALMWTINGKSYPDIEPIQARAGERIRVRWTNSGYEDHPMHLHGHSFQVVAINGLPLDGPIKDTLTVRHGEQYEVEFVANNPGTWLLHCHNLVHMSNGMLTDVQYR